MKIPVNEIVVGNRHRKNPGDLGELAHNIAQVGLLQPICVTPDKVLVDGWRRLEAVKLLGWPEIDCHVHNLHQIVDGEFSAEVFRKNLTISELAALYLEVKPLLQEMARQRMAEGGRKGGAVRKGSAKITDPSETPQNRSDRKSGRRKHMGGRTRDLIEQYSGGLWSGQTIERAAAICQAARDEPEKYGRLQQEMDEGFRSPTSAFRVYKAMQEIDAVPEPPPPADGKFYDEIIEGDCLEWLKKFADNTFDACHTDPLFGVGFKYAGKPEPINRDPEAYWAWLKPIYEQIVRVVKPGGLIAIHQSLYYARHLWSWFGDNINLFAYCKCFVPCYNMGDYTWAWHPIVVTWKEGKPLFPRRKTRSLNHFTSKYPADDIARRHPCPLPDDFSESFISTFTIEKGWILDPFAGSGSISLACAATGRHFTGIEQNRDYVALARKRLAMRVNQPSDTPPFTGPLEA